MAGPSAFFAELVPVLLPGLILVGVVASVWRQRRAREPLFLTLILLAKSVPKAVLFLEFLVVGVLTIGFFYIVPVRFFH